MKLYSEGRNYKLYEGNMLDMLEVIEPNSIDAIVTDPPYGLTSITKRVGKEGSAPIPFGKDGAFSRLDKGFMGKEWDGSGIEYNVEAWKKCFTVLKSGGYLLAFGGTRTFHRIACAIEDAGFEIRDTICWLYGSGFPKSMNIGLSIDKKNGVESEFVRFGVSGSTSKAFNLNDQQREAGTGVLAGEYEIRKAQNEWDGWGTALKPAYEPIIVARKPCEGSCVDNVLKYGVGGINIDECRIPTNDTLTHGGNLGKQAGDDRTGKALGMFQEGTENTFEQNPNGRYPANVILTYDETDMEEVCGGMPYTESNGGATTMPDFIDAGAKNVANGGMNKVGYNVGETATRKESSYVAPIDSGSAARYFYCAKASQKDRDEGLEAFETKKTGELQGGRQEGSAGSIMQNADGTTRVNPYAGTGAPKKNTHPTVKPCELMQYLIKLVTPKGGTVLDPFNGSGSTGKACMYENRERQANYNYIGIELTPEYLPISDARISVIANQPRRRRLI